LLATSPPKCAEAEGCPGGWAVPRRDPLTPQPPKPLWAATMCCVPFVKAMWVKYATPNFYYYPELVRGTYCAPHACAEAFVWLASLTPAALMGAFLFGFTSFLTAMLSFHFISCVLLPLMYVLVFECGKTPGGVAGVGAAATTSSSRSVRGFLLRQLRLRDWLVSVPPPGEAPPCCAITKAPRALDNAEQGNAGFHAPDERVALTAAQTGSVAPEDFSRAADGAAGADDSPQQQRLRARMRMRLPVGNGLLVLLAVVSWIASAGFGLLVAWVVSLIDVLWNDLLRAIVDAAESRFRVLTGAEAIFIAVWFCVVRRRPRRRTPSHKQDDDDSPTHPFNPLPHSTPVPQPPAADSPRLHLTTGQPLPGGDLLARLLGREGASAAQGEAVANGGHLRVLPPAGDSGALLYSVKSRSMCPVCWVYIVGARSPTSR
jgi:hypothetical protein